MCKYQLYSSIWTYVYTICTLLHIKIQNIPITLCLCLVNLPFKPELDTILIYLHHQRLVFSVLELHNNGIILFHVYIYVLFYVWLRSLRIMSMIFTQLLLLSFTHHFFNCREEFLCLMYHIFIFTHSFADSLFAVSALMNKVVILKVFWVTYYTPSFILDIHSEWNCWVIGQVFNIVRNYKQFFTKRLDHFILHKQCMSASCSTFFKQLCLPKSYLV